MEEVGKEGRTVLFVSHSMSTVRQLCTRACLLTAGSVTYDGLPADAISHYMQEGLKKESGLSKDYRHIKGDGKAHIQKITVNGILEAECTISVFEDIKISLDYVINEEIKLLEFFLLVYSLDGEVQASLFQRDCGNYTIPQSNGGTVTLKFKNYLQPGKYILSAGIFDQSRQFVDWVEHVEYFYVESSFHDGRKHDNRLGKVSFLADWQS
jgi:lipopolysaccharide transport system ATP-binding protein